MKSIEQLIKILEKECSKLQDDLEQARLTPILDSFISLTTEHGAYNLTKDVITDFERKLKLKKMLDEEDLSFLKEFASVPDDTKQLFGISPSLKQQFIKINNKVREYKSNIPKSLEVSELDENLDLYKSLIESLNQNNLSIIKDIELISVLMQKYNLSNEEQIRIYNEINSINLQIYEKHNAFQEESLYEDEEVTVDLTENDMGSDKLEYLFRYFNINWDDNLKENFDEQAKDAKKQTILKSKNRIQKYGDFDKMFEILKFLNENKLSFVFASPEVLERTLLYSSVEDLNKLFTNIKENNLDLVETISSNLTYLYPTIKENSNYKPLSKTNGSRSKKEMIRTGNLRNFNNCISFLKEKKYDVNKAYNRCSTLFSSPIKVVSCAYDTLKLYHVDLTNIEETLSVLRIYPLQLTENLDKAIECDCFNEYCNGLSYITQKENLYKMKLAKSNGVGDNTLFSSYMYKRTLNRREIVQNDFYGVDEEDTFKKYNACDYESDIDKYYDTVKNNLFLTASSLSKLDGTIMMLDDMYKESEIKYNFDGVIISRIKVIRIYQELIKNSNIVSNDDVLMYSITKNSMLNEQELKTIENCVAKVLKQDNKGEISR